MSIEVQLVTEIPRSTRSGKYREVICNVRPPVVALPEARAS